MDEKEIKFIQDQIGYTFKNQELLVQAFTRRSYSMENGGQDNEVLEFIGDMVYAKASYVYIWKSGAGYALCV